MYKQNIRALDIIFIGPVLILIGFYLFSIKSGVAVAFGITSIIIGISTIYYNAKEYKKYEKDLE